MLLDAAESVCAAGGFEALSIRAVSEAAGMNVAAVHYHFGSKQSLFEAMFQRRIVPINEERMRLLRTLPATGTAPSLPDVIRAFITPPLLPFSGDNSSRNAGLVMMQFLGRTFVRSGEKDFLEEYYEPVRSRFIMVLADCLPGLPLQEVIWRYNMMVGTLIYAMGGPERMTRLPTIYAATAVTMPLMHEGIDMMVSFLAAGFQAPSTMRQSA
jgi:AcrR family transcriptional regulator